MLKIYLKKYFFYEINPEDIHKLGPSCSGHIPAWKQLEAVRTYPHVLHVYWLLKKFPATTLRVYTYARSLIATAAA